MDEHELALRAYALPVRFAGRLDPADLAVVREYAEVGEWGEEIDLLLACLRIARRPVTARNEQSWWCCCRPWACRLSLRKN